MNQLNDLLAVAKGLDAAILMTFVVFFGFCMILLLNRKS